MKNNTTNNAVIISGSGKITAFINGSSYVVDTTHRNYSKALEAIRAEDYDAFVNAVDLVSKIKDYFHNTKIQIKDGAIMYKGEIIHNALTKKIFNFIQNGLPVKPLLNFFENIMENPSKRAIDELANFLDVGGLPITTDGYFLAYKNVRSNYFDIHSGKFDNSIGKVCEMPRNQVCDDKDLTCSSGLHFCSIAYLPHFSDASGGHTMIVKINPKDVVSFPTDYNNTKGRTCRYEVIGEYTDDWRSKLKNEESGWDADLYDEDGNGYEDDDDYNTEDNGCDENHCFCDQTDEHGDTTCNQDQYGKKPDGSLFHNIRDAFGKFTKKNVG